MTVFAAGLGEGLLSVVTDECTGAHDQVDVVLQERRGVIHADLRVGADVSAAHALLANQRLSNTGYILGGRGFVLTAEMARLMKADAECAQLIFPLFNGLDITGTCRNNFVIDAHGLPEEDLRKRAPAIWQLLHDRVLPERQVNSDPRVRAHWWLFRRSNEQLREASKDLARLVVTCETSKHRVFSFVDAGCRPEHTLVVFAVSDALVLGVLSTVVHCTWALATGGTLEDRPRYNKTRCFETFPFPDDDTGLTPELADRIRDLAEQLDAHRKARQAAHESVTLTGLYNVLARLRSGAALTAKEQMQHSDGLVGVLQSLHDDLDAAVLAAYGWMDLVPVPWSDVAAREVWTETLLERLVSLNARRAAEEARGVVRWLRPEFQDPARRAAADAQRNDERATDSADADDAAVATDAGASADRALRPERRPWPAESREQLRSVADLLAASPLALTEDEIAARFTARGPWKRRLPDVLSTLEALARVRFEAGRWRGVRSGA